MCEPTTIGMLLVAAAGTKIEKDAIDAAADDQAAASERLARNAERVAAENARIQRQKSRTLLARQRAAFAKGGVRTSGTPEQVLAQTAFDEELTALSILTTGRMDTDAAMRSSAARRKEGRASSRAATIRGVTTAVRSTV